MNSPSSLNSCIIAKRFEREMPGLCTPSSAAALRLFNAWLESQAEFCLSVSVNYLHIPKYGTGQETQGIYMFVYRTLSCNISWSSDGLVAVGVTCGILN